MERPFCFWVFEDWLAFLDSPEGYSHRLSSGQDGTDSDVAGLFPTGRGRAILTVGDLRKIVLYGMVADVAIEEMT